jgi:predicted permease
MFRLWRDVRHALRSLRRSRSVTSLAVLAFALGIGITTAVFTLFHGVLVKPLPYPDPDRLVIVYDVQPACATCPASFTKYVDWKTRSTSFQAMAGSSTSQVVVTGAGDPDRLPAAPATWTLPDVFGVRPEIGRWFSEAEDRPGGTKVVVLAHGYWQSRFAGDRAVLGRSLTIGGVPHEVIGVMPAGFAHRRAELFVPVQRAFDPAQRGNHFMQTYARLKPGVSVEAARQEMRTLGEALKTEFGHNHGIDVVSYYRAVVGNVERPLQVLMGAVALVLLIASANVANLLLASGLARRRELAVRSALGATRWDLARQLAVESVLLAIAGGTIGLLAAQWLVTTFVRLAGNTLPRTAALGIDGSVLIFAMLLSLATGIFCGLWPVMRMRSRTLAHAVREGDLRTGSEAGGRRFGGGLMVAEIALAFSLLVGAGLLVKNLMGLQARDTGFRPERLVAFDVAPTGASYRENAQIKQFYLDLIPRLSSLPHVQAVGATSHLPMYQFGWNGEVVLEGGNPWQPHEAPLIERAWVDAGYFGAMGIAIVRGRTFDARDREGGARATIISARTAEKFWPGQDPIGRRFARGGSFNLTDLVEVIGVAADVRTYGLGSVSPYIMYVSTAQEVFGPMTIVMRTTTGDAMAAIAPAREIVKQIDPLMPVTRVQAVQDVVAQSVSQPRLISSLTALFAALAGALAAVGVYGVTAYNVRRERREFGIRLALGADPSRVRRLIVGRGLLLGAIGIALGAGAALLLTKTVAAMLSDVAPTDPAVFAMAGALLLATVLLAVYLPARQASRTSPMVVLRAD